MKGILKPPVSKSLFDESHCTDAQLARFTGSVQGVGFRPFVYQLAVKYKLTGWVQNRVGSVYIHVEGDSKEIKSFLQEVVEKAPKHARPLLDSLQCVEPNNFSDFRVLISSNEYQGSVSIPKDTYLCNACVEDLNSSDNFRYQYPFINCSHCGPRYTIIAAMPYDRSNTSMRSFSLCMNCNIEYETASDRRFHAEPIACGNCGPSLSLRDARGRVLATEASAVISIAANKLVAGATIAMKSVGGYHLICDATNELAIEHLRVKKHRPNKPFAVMFPEVLERDILTRLAADVSLSRSASQVLLSDLRPILILPKNSTSTLPRNIAPMLSYLGVMLPCSALHRLLLEHLERPLIVTSANISGEPVMTKQSQIYEKLGDVVDYVLSNNRRIVRPVDDSVMRINAGSLSPVRLGRGFSPLELQLPFAVESPTLAVGAHQKNTVSLAWEDRLVVSPHIGDLTSIEAQRVFKNTIDDLQKLYGVRAEAVICDNHPDYASSKWAQNSGLIISTVQHHQAHASAWAFENCLSDASLVLVWDGVGLGDNGQLWGGEFFYGSPGHWQRVASFKPFTIQGGELSGRAPWRSAAALSWQSDMEWEGLQVCDPHSLAKKAWQNNILCHKSTSAGRLFDAAAAIILNLHNTTYEAQGPLQLESMVKRIPLPIFLPLVCVEKKFWEIDWTPLMAMLLNSTISAESKAEIFHASMVSVIDRTISQLSSHFRFQKVGLAGGVFQNQILFSWLQDTNSAQEFEISLPKALPANDGSISAGQIMEHLGKSRVLPR